MNTPHRWGPIRELAAAGAAAMALGGAPQKVEAFPYTEPAHKLLHPRYALSIADDVRRQACAAVPLDRPYQQQLQLECTPSDAHLSLPDFKIVPRLRDVLIQKSAEKQKVDVHLVVMVQSGPEFVLSGENAGLESISTCLSVGPEISRSQLVTFELAALFTIQSILAKLHPDEQGKMPSDVRFFVGGELAWTPHLSNRVHPTLSAIVGASIHDGHSTFKGGVEPGINVLLVEGKRAALYVRGAVPILFEIDKGSHMIPTIGTEVGFEGEFH